MEKNKEKLIVGDLHGQKETMYMAYKYAKENDLQIIFLGDLTDSFKRSKNDQLECIQQVTKYLDEGHKCVWGNHDLSYLYPNTHNCAGWSYTKEKLFKDAYKKLNDHKNFVPFIYLEEHKILITHAGLSDKLIPEEYKDSPIKYLEEQARKEDFIKKSPLLKAGRISGGPYEVGGITWMRPHKYVPLENNIRQIAGHTPQRGGTNRSHSNLWIIDTIEYGYKELIGITSKGEINILTMEDYW